MSDTVFYPTSDLLRAMLPAAILRAMESYDGFARADSPADAKGFVAHHNACKAALAHLSALLKMAHSLKAATGGNENSHLDELISQARQMLVVTETGCAEADRDEA